MLLPGGGPITLQFPKNWTARNQVFVNLPLNELMESYFSIFGFLFTRIEILLVYKKIEFSDYVFFHL